MAAARYWRLVGIQTYADGDLEISELQLYSAAGREDAAATLTCSFAPTAGALADLSDGSTAGAVRFAAHQVRAPGFRFVWDFGAGAAVDIVVVRVGAAASQDRFLYSATLEYFDGSSWVSSTAARNYPYPGDHGLTDTTVGDPYFSNVSLLLHGEGTDLGTVYTDSSTFPKTLTAGGTVQTRTARAYMGASSIYFGGNGYLKLPTSSDLSMGTGDFTVEFMVWPSGPQSGSCWLFISSSFYIYNNALNVDSYVASGLQDFQNRWGWVVISRRGGVLEARLDGLLRYSGSHTAAVNFSGAEFGRYPPNSNLHFTGYMDEIRITQGVARYAGFEPVPTSTFPEAVGASLWRGNLHTSRASASAPWEGEAPGAVGFARAGEAELLRDMEFGGTASITGTVGIKGTGGAPDTMTKSRVRLLRQRDGLLAREVWSDPVTGAFAFHGLDPAQQFIALAEDQDGVFAPVAADRRTPEVPT